MAEYHSCHASGCNRWIPKASGDFCERHGTPLVHAVPITTNKLAQCEHTEATGVCTNMTVNRYDGRVFCYLHKPAEQTADDDVKEAAEASVSDIEFYSIEDIDWDIYKRTWNTRDFRRSKFPTVESIHFRFKLKGPEKNQLLFHAMMKASDSEYPLDPERKRNVPLDVCEKCGGIFWHNAVPEPEEIKRAAKQAGLKKILMIKWQGENKCRGPLVKKVWNHGLAGA